MKKNRNKGFTLVELIVVIVILAILAAILLPALLGYIDRAKQQKDLRKMHDIQIAATSALSEYYAVYAGKPGYTFTPRNYKTPKGDNIRGYNITNYTFSRLQNGSADSSTKGSNAVANLMLKYLDSTRNDSDRTYDFTKYNASPYSVKASAIAAENAEGLVIIFDEEYRIMLIQYSDTDGYLYTYEAKRKSIDAVKDGTFIATGK